MSINMVGLPPHLIKKRPAKRRRFGRDVPEQIRLEERKKRNRLAAADYRKRDQLVEMEAAEKCRKLKEDISRLRKERDSIRCQNELLERHIAAAHLDDGNESQSGYFSDSSDPSSPRSEEEPDLDIDERMFLELPQTTGTTGTTKTTTPTTPTDIAPPPCATYSAVCDGSVNQVLKPSVFNNSPHTRPTRSSLNPIFATLFIHLIWLLWDQQTVDQQLRPKNQSVPMTCSIQSALPECRSLTSFQPPKMVLT